MQNVDKTHLMRSLRSEQDYRIGKERERCEVDKNNDRQTDRQINRQTDRQTAFYLKSLSFIK